MPGSGPPRPRAAARAARPGPIPPRSPPPPRRWPRWSRPGSARSRCRTRPPRRVLHPHRIPNPWRCVPRRV
ncbi:MAG TPA: protease, partial [Roseovarius sp.]|nr:protease [Roseovarius sp.]